MSFFDKFKKKGEQTESASVARQVVDAAKNEEKVKEVKEEKEEKEEKRAPAKMEKKLITAASAQSLSTIIEPIVSEKTAQLSDQGVMVFKVNPKATRIAVSKAFKEMYRVTPVKVNIANVRGKRLRFGRIQGKRCDYKKAMIMLPKGTRIDIFDGV
ncbi:MAG: 50S ribosomal protein L23 [bacterium]